MTYLFSSNVEVSNDIGNPLPIVGNLGVLNGGSIVTINNPLPVTLGNANIIITGNTNIIDTVKVYSDINNPVHIHITEIGSSGNLVAQDIDYMPIKGNVTVTNGNLSVFGNISGITSLPPVSITGNVNVNPVTISTISSNVNVNPITGNISVYGNVGINGNISGITSLPPVTILGNVNVNPISVTGITTNVNVVVKGNIDGITSLPPVSITGNVNVNPVTATIIGNVEITNDLGNPIPVTGNLNATISSGNVTVVNSEINPVLVKYSDKTNTQLDTNQRLRVTIPQQQHWYVPSVDKDGDLRYNELLQGTRANIQYVHALASINLTSGNVYSSNTQLTGTAIRASRRRHKIRPGISHQWLSMMNWDGVQTNVVKRAGMFTNYNGMFFEVSDDLYCVVRRRLMDGTPVEVRTPRGNFNQDPLNGTGPSTLDFTSNTVITGTITGHISTANITQGQTTVYKSTFNTASNIAAVIGIGNKVTVSGTNNQYDAVAMITGGTSNTIDLTYVNYPGNSSISSGTLTHSQFHNTYTWWFDFNGGRNNAIRFGINYGGELLPIHIQDFKSNIGSSYENSPALMDRVEIVNTGTINGLPSVTFSGVTVNVEAEAELSPGFGYARAEQTVSFSKSLNEEYAILGIGLRYGEPYQRADIQLQRVNFVDIANINPQNAAVFEWRIVLNPTLTGSTAIASNIGKATQMWDYNQGVIASGGSELMGGYVTSGLSSEVTTALNFLNMGSNINYTDADKVVLVVKQISKGINDANIVASFDFIESL